MVEWRGYKNLAEMFWDRIERSKDKVAHIIKIKEEGRWIKRTWREVGEITRNAAKGLLSLGIKKGDKVCIMAQTRAEWVYSDFAILSIGGITVPIYHSNTPEQSEYIINDSEARAVIVEDLLQLEKMLKIRNNIPQVLKIIVMEGYKDGKDEWVISWEKLLEIGKNYDDKGYIDRTIKEIKPDDIATIVYTSGTTGPPKGVVQTHWNHLAMIKGLTSLDIIKEESELDLMFLPLAHSFGRCGEFAEIYLGNTVAFAESIQKVVDNMAEIKPTVIYSVPRIYEKIYAAAHAKAKESPIKEKIFNWALKVGRKRSECIQKKKPIPLSVRIKFAIAEKLIFNKIKQLLGGNLRYAISGGAPLSKEIAEFFHAAGLLILEGYGLTETCPALTINRPDNFKFGSVGLPIPGCKIKIAEDGEILGAGENIAKGYYKKPEATKEAFLEDGWFRTGDIGFIDEDGFLHITDRKKDLIVTAGGKNVAPQNIENMVKADPFISQIVVLGDRKPYLVALITVNKEEAEKFAREKGINFSSYEELTKHPLIYQRVKETIDSVNSRLASYETIKKFAILPVDFTIESGELTPTLKVKRKVVYEKYKDIIENLYAS